MSLKIGFVGLGKMGKHMVLRLLKNKYEVVAFNRSPEPTKELVKEGAIGAFTLKEVVDKLKGEKQKVIWMMVPQIAVDGVLDELLPMLSKGDLIIDGGNSNYNLTVARSLRLKKLGIKFMDIGVSGGLVASKIGYCMMIGGDKQDFATIETAVKTMCVPDGYLHVGPNGSGHYVKMVHNAIEYGMMQAMGEGFELLDKGPYSDLDYKKISHLWNNGSIVRGFLMEMAESAFSKDAKLSKISGFIEDTGEGRWATEEALKFNVPFTVNSYALFARYISRQKDPISNKLIAALRDEFGGHGTKKK